MKSYTFPIEIEPDEDRWFARVPELEAQGAAAWGVTKEEAIRNIQEVAQMVIESLLEDGGDSIPVGVIDANRATVIVTV
ncbi:MAG: type II toxin-antitoxin system HicB family antitoxin [Candidatus Hydrogenedentes bacterium]|nr:type II toxin-antitoxin system HicB family antitoxin [Candidatus Hydrogenedentota bacterium]